MQDALLSIGRMAKINNISIPTLRLYDELGLLKPRRIDPDTGYRYYDIGQNARLDMIAYMKELGMSLSEIGDVLKTGDRLHHRGLRHAGHLLDQHGRHGSGWLPQAQQDQGRVQLQR